MGRFRRMCPRWCRCGLIPGCSRGNYSPNEGAALQTLPRPKEADVVDGMPYIDDKEEKDILIIRSIDANFKINGPLHYTSRYEVMTREIDPQLVVRRGQPFLIDLNLSRPFKEEQDAVSFIFTVEDESKPNYGHGTLVAIPLLRKPEKYQTWQAIIESADDNNLRVAITPSSDSVVAKWRMEIDTKALDNGAYSYCWETGIYILFNPWCKQDQVFLKNEEWRHEAVLSDVGLIWRGTFNRQRPCIWKYSQFDKHVLDSSLFLVNQVGRVRGNDKADPVIMARALSAAVNSVDDNGAVMGNWSEDFGGGTPPTNWIGSAEILQKFWKKKKPVKYGQCWVFAGVLTTVCRALGLPARTITNYSSAHDTQSSLTVDFFMDEEGKILEDLNSDSIWTFHVWNEVWMQRPDLGKDYGGWQAIDATPQELSEDAYRVGPTSVVAIKLGEVKRPYDSGFLFSEVNADKVFWRYTGPTQPLKLLGKDIYGIGKLIVTKSPTRWDKEDITSTYKHPEKTHEERVTMLKALRQSENLFARYYLNEDFNDIHFNFELKDDIKIGQTFDVSLVMRNRSKSKDYKVNVTLRVDSVSYTGRIGELVKRQNFDIQVKAESIHEVKLTVKYEEYEKRLVDQGSFQISCLATIEDTKFEYYAQDDFRVRKPDIKINLANPPIQGQEMTADLTLENPLPVQLQKCEFDVEAPGLEKKLKIKLKKNILAGGKAEVEIKFTPTEVGRQTIAAKFISKELKDVDGYLVFIVEPAKNEANGNS